MGTLIPATAKFTSSAKGAMSGHVWSYHLPSPAACPSILLTSAQQEVTIAIMVSPSAAVLPFPPLGTTWVEAAEGESAVTHISIRSIDADRIHK